MVREIDFPGVVELLRSGRRVLLVMRHAHRPRVSPFSKDWGFDVPITPKGVVQAFRAGECLRDFRKEVQFLASPFLRARMTCAMVREGMGWPLGKVEISEGRTGWDWVEAADYLGYGCPFVESRTMLQNRFEAESFKVVMTQYLESGQGSGFNELYPAAERFEELMVESFKSRLGVYVTHDWYCAAFLRSRGYDADRLLQTWIGNCDSVAVAIDNRGGREYAVVRLCPSLC